MSQLENGPYGLCSWIPTDDGKYIKSNQTNEMICCMKVCRSMHDSCKNRCQGIEGIEGTCNGFYCTTTKDVCMSNCRLSYLDEWGIDNPFGKSTEYYGCGRKYKRNADKKCIFDNSVKIKEMCVENCVPSSRINCEHHCDFAYDLALGNHTLDYMF